MRQRYIDRLYQFSSVNRPLDIFYPTNLAIVILAPLSGVIANLLYPLHDVSPDKAGVFGISVAIQVFIGWVLAREIDPDHELSAFAAAGVAFITALLAPLPTSLGAILPLVAMTRTLNRIVGPPARLTDSIIILLFVGVTIFAGEWMFGLVAILTFAMDAILEKPLRTQWLFAGASALLTVGYMLTNALTPLGAFSLPILGAALVLSALYSAYIITTQHIETKTDYTNESLSVRRVQAAMAITLLTGVVFLWYGDAGFWKMLPLWTTLLVVMVWRVLPLPNPSFAVKRETHANQ